MKNALKDKMKIGIFGGTFNPPHLAHLNIANDFLERLNLDKVVVIPTFQPPHKQAKCLADSEDRIEMCKLLFDDEKFFVSDIEVERQGKSYTYDTLCQMEELYKDSKFYLIIGSDMLLSFHLWYRYENILKKATLCVLTREKDIDNHHMKRYAREVLSLGENEIIFSSLPAYEMSSTQVRDALFAGENPIEYVGEKVSAYIEKKGLYMNNYDTEKIKLLLRERLDDYRYNHSMGVADMAKILAQKHGEDPDKAYIAGLVHDITKNEDNDKQLQIIENSGIILSLEEKKNPKLWHAISGSVYVRDELGFDDEIVSAVRWHTTGKSGMTLLEKIIYVADFVSMERSFPGVDFMRQLAYEDLDKACLFAVDFCIPDLVKKRQVLHPDSVALYNELVMNSVEYNNERKMEDDKS